MKTKLKLPKDVKLVDGEYIKYMYHIFCDGFDDWADNLKEANAIYKGMATDNPRQGVRMYKEYEVWTKEEAEDGTQVLEPSGDFVEEDLIRSRGAFPS